MERLIRPATAGPPGLLVLLHGLGSDEHDLFAAAAYVDPRFTVTTLRAPLRYAGGGYAWFSLTWDGDAIQYDAGEARASLALLQEELIAIKSELEVSSERTVIGGFSQGAAMSTGLLLTGPGAVGGALLMSGAVLPDMVPPLPMGERVGASELRSDEGAKPGGAAARLPGLRASPKNRPGTRARLPILIQHGTFDPVLPVRLGREIRDTLIAQGFQPDYREYSMAHEVSTQSLQDAQSWLAKFAEDR